MNHERESNQLTLSLFSLSLSRWRLKIMMRKLAFFCVVFAVTLKPLLRLSSSSSSSSQHLQHQDDLQYDFYRETCPQAEQIIRSAMKELFSSNPSAAPQLLRLLFHDCFIQGCDASILLKEDYNNGKTEKDAIPNQTIKGFDKIEIIKSRIEESCPGIVSCADILVLATREGILLAGGPFYPVFTGRRDSYRSYYATATKEIPSPKSNITSTIALFASRGFNQRETVALLGAHNIGSIDCLFIRDRIFNFTGTGRPDSTLPADFLKQLMANCSRGSGSGLYAEAQSTSLSYYQALSPSMPSGTSFDTHYYKSLMRGRGLLFADQQLMAESSTAALVAAYASDDGSAFRRDFARVMMKLSSIRGSLGDQGNVRFNCSKLN